MISYGLVCGCILCLIDIDIHVYVLKCMLCELTSLLECALSRCTCTLHTVWSLVLVMDVNDKFKIARLLYDYAIIASNDLRGYISIAIH